MKIKSVLCPEPRRDGEYPAGAHVGCRYNASEVATIEEVQENLGTYGITWFVAKDAAGNVVVKFNAANVVYVDYVVEA